MIELENVSVRFEGRRVLQDLNLALTEKRIGVIGLNGSGKSTFARLLNGLQLPTEGAVTVGGMDTAKSGKDVRRQVGFVFQNPENQIVYPIVREDLAFGLKNLGLAKADIPVQVERALERFRLQHLIDRRTHELSGGEKQMIALIGVAVMNPRLIVMDEPTTLLDLRNKRRLMQAVSDMEQSVVMITHDLDLLSAFDRVLCFHEGRLFDDGAPEAVIARYQQVCEEC
ncbi:energy-coupling factor ABC transporter ATP-binding protein [Sneathiella chinensis]|uniref:ABC transporter ATP-binding protein n=1 Tax=Sneathiella chinensis TaxID=349750 RepID=A0ABQ5U562_9PROT|nr:ABC transporter ATP-binding protein [Sneathiella chinensis]GLQ06815.1 ABC transporter ATP-binding protein [Sneathiella chinensis]